MRKLFTDSYPHLGAAALEKAKSKQFLKNMRHYNNDCACASLSYRLVNVNTPGPFLYKIQGTICHYKFNISEIGDGELARRNQLYIVCTADQNEQGTAQNSLLREDILTDIKRALDASNETYRNLKQMFELANTNDISIVFAPVSPDRPNACNAALPEAREVVSVFNENADESERGITIHLRYNNDKVFFSYDKGVCDPLTYPLIFPNGELGWDRSLRQSEPDSITPMHFFSHNLSIREDPLFWSNPEVCNDPEFLSHFNSILHSGDDTKNRLSPVLHCPGYSKQLTTAILINI